MASIEAVAPFAGSPWRISIPGEFSDGNCEASPKVQVGWVFGLTYMQNEQVQLLCMVSVAVFPMVSACLICGCNLPFSGPAGVGSVLSRCEVDPRDQCATYFFLDLPSAMSDSCGLGLY
ncbi:unnamed protein product [Amoebophrya sp. A25]|nr:unnamed protein product [Amoebophrya sp. A25]|eukprot:GSA25T00024818001.1